ncbi:MAG: DUF2470 domain-containing protein [Fimbriimonadaceae bacterium]|nr:DUF2470 domain-containing protein [Alphaproteobacteria bacterium]
MKTEKKPDAFEARQIVRQARQAALATLDATTGAPYVSLAAVATLADGRPVTLISTLARHTQNLRVNPAVSLLFEIPAQTGGVMAGSRVTLSGRLLPCDDEQARRRYLARHGDAADFVDFPDFGFYALDIEEGHFIAAFGRIRTIAGDKLSLNTPLDDELARGEGSAVSHMNEDHLDAIQRYAVEIGGAAPGDWRMTDIDREGFSLISDSGLLRIIFPKPLESFGDLRKCLAEMAQRTKKS